MLGECKQMVAGANAPNAADRNFRENSDRSAATGLRLSCETGLLSRRQIKLVSHFVYDHDVTLWSIAVSHPSTRLW